MVRGGQHPFTLSPQTADTLELQALLNGGGTVTLESGRTYRIDTVSMHVAGTALVIPASTTVEIVDDGTTASQYIEVSANGCSVSGSGTIRGTSDTRTAVYGLLRAVDADDLTVSGVTIHTSPSNAIWVRGGDSLDVSGVTVHSTAADGIQITRGATNFTVDGNTIYDTGDDGIGVNSYNGFDPCSGGLITGNSITNVTLGRGVAINGGDTITVSDNTIDGTDQAAVLVSRVTGETNDPSEMTVIDNVLLDYGRNPPMGGTTASVYFAFCAGGRIANNSDPGAVVVEGTSSDIDLV